MISEPFATSKAIVVTQVKTLDVQTSKRTYPNPQAWDWNWTQFDVASFSDGTRCSLKTRLACHSDWQGKYTGSASCFLWSHGEWKEINFRTESFQIVDALQRNDLRLQALEERTEQVQRLCEADIDAVRAIALTIITAPRAKPARQKEG